MTATSKPTDTPLPTDTPEPTITPTPTITRPPLEQFDASMQTVTIRTEDNVALAGTYFESTREGDVAVVMTHMGGDYDQQSWLPFAEQVAQHGTTALTFDFRCAGQSECAAGLESGSVLASRDISAAIDFLRQKGYPHVVCLGASAGGRGCVTVAFEEELAGLVILAGTRSSDPERQNLEDFVSPGMPKLFILSEKDATKNVHTEMDLLYENAPEPKTFRLYPGSAHGTELFNSQYAVGLREVVYYFLEDIRAPKP
jgi:dienelactone hydrolase